MTKYTYVTVITITQRRKRNWKWIYFEFIPLPKCIIKRQASIVIWRLIPSLYLRQYLNHRQVKSNQSTYYNVLQKVVLQSFVYYNTTLHYRAKLNYSFIKALIILQLHWSRRFRKVQRLRISRCTRAYVLVESFIKTNTVMSIRYEFRRHFDTRDSSSRNTSLLNIKMWDLKMG